jgi:hypothetical protein
MPKEAASGYVEPVGCSDVIDLHVLCLNGDGCALVLSPGTLGREVRQLVLEQLGGKKGRKLALHHNASLLMPGQTLQEQGICQAATLSCTFVPIDLCAAYRDLGFAGNICFLSSSKFHHLGNIFGLGVCFFWMGGRKSRLYDR